MSFLFRLRLTNPNRGRPALFGTTFYRQQPDPTNPRGHRQSAIVILSETLHCDAARHMSTIIGPAALEHGCLEQILEEAYRVSATWPEPIPGDVVLLPLLGEAASVAIPRPVTQTSGRGKVHPSKQMHDLGEAYAECSRRAVDPPPRRRHRRSRSVHGIIPTCPIPGAPVPAFSFLFSAGDAPPSLTSPISTLQQRHGVTGMDSFMGHLHAKVSRVKAHLAGIWAVFEALLVGKPILVIGQTPPDVGAVVLGLISLIAPAPYGGDYRPYLPIYDKDFDSIFQTMVPASTVVGVTNPLCERWAGSWPVVVRLGGDTKFRIDVNFSPAIQPDPAAIKDAGKCRGLDDVESVVRHHLAVLMDEFLEPFDRYFRPPALNALAPEAFLESPDAPEPFNAAELLASVKKKPTMFRMKKKEWRGLYSAFVDTPTCAALLEVRDAITPHELRTLYRTARINLNAASMADGRDGLGCFSLVNQIKRLLDKVSRVAPGDYELLSALNQHVRTLADIAETRIAGDR